jgi:hypothetical protein
MARHPGETALLFVHRSRRTREPIAAPTHNWISSAAVASAVFATPRWCLGGTHLPERVTSNDESVGFASERASRERELPDRS